MADNNVSNAFTKSEKNIETVLYVPVSKDGSRFLPELQKNGGFIVGEKGGEKKFHSFEKALNELKGMKSPKWRRPNKKGNWGIVTGIKWEKITLKL